MTPFGFIIQLKFRSGNMTDCYISICLFSFCLCFVHATVNLGLSTQFGSNLKMEKEIAKNVGPNIKCKKKYAYHHPFKCFKKY